MALIRHTIWSATSDTSMLHANFVPMFYSTGVIADGNFTLREYGFCTFSAPMTLTLTWWPSRTNLTRIPYIPDVQVSTSYVEAFESYHLRGRHNTTEIICFTDGQKFAPPPPKSCGPMRPHSSHRLKAVTTSGWVQRVPSSLASTTTSLYMPHRMAACQNIAVGARWSRYAQRVTGSRHNELLIAIWMFLCWFVQQTVITATSPSSNTTPPRQRSEIQTTQASCEIKRTQRTIL